MLGFCCAVFVFVLILTYILIPSKEDFATKEDKAKAVMSWFKETSKPTYTEFKREFNDTSNVVEYEDALKLYQNGNFTVDEVEKII